MIMIIYFFTVGGKQSREPIKKLANEGELFGTARSEHGGAAFN